MIKLAALFFPLLVLAWAAPGQLPSSPAFLNSRILGGINALPHEFPSMVSVRRVVLIVTTHICGGTILNNFWVMTAAHCITDSPANSRFVIWAGAHNFNQNEPARQVMNVIGQVIHPNYTGGVNPSDIALLRLQGPLSYNTAVQPVRLPADNSTPRLGPVSLVGWGTTSSSTSALASVLQKARVPLIDWKSCEEANGGAGASPLGPTNICTGPLTGGVSACSGDSGGPIYVVEDGLQTQVGIASWGWMPCGSIGRPSMYVGVSHYSAWVRQQIGG